MQDDTVLQKFQKFKTMLISSDMPNNLLLEMLESYLTSDDKPPPEEIPVLDGQLSMLDTTA